MQRMLYHGSSNMIEKPIYGYGKAYNDYGPGFYCTENRVLANEWAVGKDRDGYCNGYQIRCDGLAILDLNSPEYCILHWLSLLLCHREFDVPSALAYEAREYLIDHFSIDTKKYDVIVGYRADDSYFSFAQDFINGTISYRQLTNAMYLGNLGEQFVLKSRTAFERLQFTGAEKVLSTDWYTRKIQRDKQARRAYFDVERNKRQRGDIYITQIMDEEMTTNDLRLRQGLSGKG